MKSIIKKLYTMDDYEVHAIMLPTSVNLILLIIIMSVSDITSMKWWTIFGYSSIVAIVALRLFMTLFREVSKMIISIRWKKKDIPTTQYLGFGKGCSSQQRKQLIKAIKDDFGISIPIAIPNENQQNFSEYVQIIYDATARVRDIMSKTNSVVLRQLSQRYGQTRNFIGGALLSIIAESVIMAVFGYHRFCFIVLALHLIIAIIAYFSLTKRGYEYAEKLFINYLNSHE